MFAKAAKTGTQDSRPQGSLTPNGPGPASRVAGAARGPFVFVVIMAEVAGHRLRRHLRRPTAPMTPALPAT